SSASRVKLCSLTSASPIPPEKSRCLTSAAQNFTPASGYFSGVTKLFLFEEAVDDDGGQNHAAWHDVLPQRPTHEVHRVERHLHDPGADQHAEDGALAPLQ